MTHPTILLVDDCPDVRATLAFVLMGAGHTVLEAVNGAEAIRLAKTHLPNLICTDLDMPELDGWSLRACLADESNTRGIPVVAVTGESAAGITDRLRSGGFLGHLPKPLSADEVLRGVQEALQAHASGQSWFEFRCDPPAISLI